MREFTDTTDLKAEVGISFDALVSKASDHEPYDYQRRLASKGLPELLRAPTGAGKTLAATLPWLYRRRFHPDPDVRAATPHWLALVLPMRVLVEQTAGVVARWLDRLGIHDMGPHVVMGGEGRLESGWRAAPERDAVFIGTLDMLLSRALNRGYGESRFAWPLDFGLFNAGTQWVFDEIQLMGPALPTSRQLEGLRRALGTALPCASMWMSATIDLDQLATVDLPTVTRVVEPSEADWAGPLQPRLRAAKAVRRVPISGPGRYVQDIAGALVAAHRAGTLTLAILNTVARARELQDALAATHPAAELVLLHSRFFRHDRARQVATALAAVDPHGPGRMVVSTQVVEAGVDVSATTLFTEAAPWPSVVQRAGRCNRDGKAQGALLLWAPPPRPEPYADADVQAAAAELDALEGDAVTGPGLSARAVRVQEVVHPVLRRRDLLELFDTTPDLSGNDVDVGRFLRPVDGLDVQVAWRAVGASGPADDSPPTAGELCPVPLHEARDGIAAGRRAWRFDHVDERWVACGTRELRPGLIVVLDAAAGGYRPDVGWDPTSRTPVSVGAAVERDAPSPLAGSEEATGDDPLTRAPGQWVPLCRHLEDVEHATRELATTLLPLDLNHDQLEAAAVAARLHDIGKAHPVFQDTLRRSAANDRERADAAGTPTPWAKSGGSGRVRHRRRHFRHELVSALALLGDGSVALDDLAERELTLYLVAAHHGRVRVGIRSLSDEHSPGRPRQVLGVQDGEVLPAVDIPTGLIPACTLDLSPVHLGRASDGRPSWTERALRLRDRPDLGPFRLAFLEALVRLADWRASARGET